MNQDSVYNQFLDDLNQTGDQNDIMNNAGVKKLLNIITQTDDGKQLVEDAMNPVDVRNQCVDDIKLSEGDKFVDAYQVAVSDMIKLNALRDLGVIPNQFADHTIINRNISKKYFPVAPASDINNILKNILDYDKQLDDSNLRDDQINIFDETELGMAYKNMERFGLNFFIDDCINDRLDNDDNDVFDYINYDNLQYDLPNDNEYLQSDIVDDMAQFDEVSEVGKEFDDIPSLPSSTDLDDVNLTRIDDPDINSNHLNVNFNESNEIKDDSIIDLSDKEV